MADQEIWEKIHWLSQKKYDTIFFSYSYAEWSYFENPTESNLELFYIRGQSNRVGRIHITTTLSKERCDTVVGCVSVVGCRPSCAHFQEATVYEINVEQTAFPASIRLVL